MTPKRIEIKERVLWFVIGFVACLLGLALLFGVIIMIPSPGVEIPYQEDYYVT